MYIEEVDGVVPAGAGLLVGHGEFVRGAPSADRIEPAGGSSLSELYLARWADCKNRRGFLSARAAKRFVEVTVAMTLLVVLSPLMVLIALVVRLTSRGPAIFQQLRVGLDSREIKVLKFRSMRADAETVLESNAELHQEYLSNGFTLDVSRDPRVTRVGRILRRTSFDELPQLWNVVRGDMSIIGPRPVRPSEVDLYGDVSWAYLAVRPGISGLWQVSGRNSILYPERAYIDANYVSSWSLLGDLRIALRTPVAMLRGSAPTVDDEDLSRLLRATGVSRDQLSGLSVDGVEGIRSDDD